MTPINLLLFLHIFYCCVCLVLKYTLVALSSHSREGRQYTEICVPQANYMLLFPWRTSYTNCIILQQPPGATKSNNNFPALAFGSIDLLVWFIHCRSGAVPNAFLRQNQKKNNVLISHCYNHYFFLCYVKKKTLTKMFFVNKAYKCIRELDNAVP